MTTARLTIEAARIKLRLAGPLIELALCRPVRRVCRWVSPPRPR